MVVADNLVELLFECGCIYFAHPVTQPNHWPNLVWCPVKIEHGAQHFVVLDNRVDL